MPRDSSECAAGTYENPIIAVPVETPIIAVPAETPIIAVPAETPEHRLMSVKTVRRRTHRSFPAHTDPNPAEENVELIIAVPAETPEHRLMSAKIRRRRQTHRRFR
jgi:hypothetical protein